MGFYRIVGRVGNYKVEANRPPEGDFHVIEFFDGKLGFGEADVVIIPGAETTVGPIDFPLAVGGAITGQVTDEATGNPIHRYRVVARLLDGDGNEVRGYGRRSDVNGNYTITGLPLGNYKVEAADPPDDGFHATEFFNNKPTFEQADVLVLAAPETTIVNVDFPLALIVRVELSSNGGLPGTLLTLDALGIKGGESVTFWIDADGDGVRDAIERDLCTVVADADDTATCNFITGNPPFVFGKGTDCTLPVLVNCNFINVIDSEGRTTNFPLALTQLAVDLQTFELEI